MASIQCPECGKELLPTSAFRGSSKCVCSSCGREVYPKAKVKAKVKCSKCGKENETLATV